MSEAAIRKRTLRRRDRSAPMTCTPAHYVGPSIRFRCPENWAMRRGQKMHGRRRVRRITGRGCRRCGARISTRQRARRSGFLRWRSRGRRSLCRHAPRAQCRNREIALAFSGRTSRHLGPRFSFASCALHIIKRNGKLIEGLAQTTKVGLRSMVFDRLTASRSFLFMNVRIRRALFPAK